MVDDDKTTAKDYKVEGLTAFYYTGAAKPETYSKPLKDKIRYVQYIPKDAKGTIEDAVN